MTEGPPPLRGRVEALLEPAQIMRFAAYHLFAVICSVIFQRRDLSALLQFSKIRQEAFSNFWLAFSAPSQTPRKLTGSATLVPPLLAQAHGDVLEIGPGSGSTIQYYEPAVGSINSLYAAEPMISLHDSLTAKATAIGLTDAFKILPCSAEKESLIPAIAKAGLIEKAIADDGMFDTIVCIRVLCSVSRTEDTLHNLYSLLKPGGQFLIVEHVKNPWLKHEGTLLGRLFQLFYTLLGWRLFVGCDIARETTDVLKTTGQQGKGWSVIDLKTHFGWTAMPYVSGRLVKRL